MFRIHVYVTTILSYISGVHLISGPYARARIVPIKDQHRRLLLSGLVECPHAWGFRSAVAQCQPLKLNPAQGHSPIVHLSPFEDSRQSCVWATLPFQIASLPTLRKQVQVPRDQFGTAVDLIRKVRARNHLSESNSRPAKLGVEY